MIPRRLLPPALLLPFLLTGCLEFGTQTMSYRYDKATDTLQIFQDYHGIFGADGKGRPDAGLSQDEQQQLESVLKGQRTFFFNNWIFEFNRAQVESQLEDLKQPDKRAELKMPDAGLASLEKLLRLLKENVRVENGPFYFDADKKLSGVQYVTVSHCSAVIAAANDFAPYFIKSQAEDDNASQEDKAVARKFAEHPLPVVQLDGNALTIQWPTPRAGYEAAFGASSNDAAKLAEARKAGLGIAWTNDLVTLKLGGVTNAVTRLTLTFSENRYSTNLVEPARKQHTVRDAFDVKAAEENFLARGRRD